MDDEIECCVVPDDTKVVGTSPRATRGGDRIKRMSRKPPSGRKRDYSSLDTVTLEALRLESLVQIDCKDEQWSGEYSEVVADASQVELILPKLLYRNESSKDVDRWHSLFPGYDYEINCEDDQWGAAKRGDLEALKQLTGVDWTKEDRFENTALYYACLSGAVRDLEVVQYLIQAWPGQIPALIVDRCKKVAINASVVRLLENPNEEVTLTVKQEKQENDIFNDSLNCLAGWNIFQEEEMECGEYGS